MTATENQPDPPKGLDWEKIMSNVQEQVAFYNRANITPRELQELRGELENSRQRIMELEAAKKSFVSSYLDAGHFIDKLEAQLSEVRQLFQVRDAELNACGNSLAELSRATHDLIAFLDESFRYGYYKASEFTDQVNKVRELANKFGGYPREGK